VYVTTDNFFKGVKTVNHGIRLGEKNFAYKYFAVKLKDMMVKKCCGLNFNNVVPIA
jgi:hypothetical protein